MVWEVRTTGSDANGGGFDPTSGTPGTDYSVQDSAQVTYTDLVIDGTTNTKCTSAGTPFTSVHVGNVINITSGTGFTVQRVQIMSVASSTATCDKSLGTLSSTGGNGVLGGALATPGKAGGLHVVGNSIYVKSGTYSLSSTNNVAGGRITLADSPNGTTPGLLIGYNTNRIPFNTDTRPTIRPSNNSMTCVNAQGYNYVLNLVIDNGNSVTGGTGILLSSGSRVENCDVTSPAIAFDISTGSSFAYNCVARSAGTVGFSVGGASHALACYAKSCAIGFRTEFLNARISRCVAYGSTTSGFEFDWTNTFMDHCVAYGTTGGPGFNLIAVNGVGLVNCVAIGNSTYGFKDSVFNSTVRLQSCAAYNNTTAATLNFNTSLNNIGFITLTADPFTNASSSDFTLNGTAGGGAALAGVGYPASFPGVTGTNAPDVGLFQKVGGSGSSGLLVHPGMGGGARG